jgi:hypothetical protein
MRLEWSAIALADLDRFAAFLQDRHPRLANVVAREILGPNGFDIAPEWLRREMDAAGELTHIAAERTLLTDGAFGGEANAVDELDAFRDCAE